MTDGPDTGYQSWHVDPEPSPIEDLEQARHIVAQGGEAGYTDRQIELAQEFITSQEDPLLEDFDNFYRCLILLEESLVEGADFRIDRLHHRGDLRQTLDDLDLIEKIRTLFQEEMDPRCA